jgi:hypothetical protein
MKFNFVGSSYSYKIQFKQLSSVSTRKAYIAALSPGFYSFELTGDGIEARNAKLIVVR